MMRLLRNEARILRREPGGWILLAGYVALLGYGCLQSVHQVRARDAQVADAATDYETRWAALRTSAEGPPGVWGDWRSPSLVGGPTGYAVTWLPVDGLAVLSPGESVRRPSVTRVSIYGGREEPPLQNPLAPAGGLFELSFVVIWLLPITVLAATHGAISADRQHGTWPLVAATTAAPGRILLARLFWPAAAVAVVTVLGGIVAVCAAGPLPDDGWLRLAAWCGLVVAYTSFWAATAGCVTARSATAPAAIVTLGLFWITMVWVVPGLVDASVAAWVPPTNRLEVYLSARESERDLERRLPALVEAVYTQHPDWRPSAAVVAAATTPVPGGPASRDSRRVYAPSLAAADAMAPFVTAIADRRERTEALVRRLSLLSPALALQVIGDHLAGTSADRYARFERHAAEAERHWHGFFAPRIMQLRDMTRADMNQVPVVAAFSDVTDSGTLRWSLVGIAAALAASAVALRQSLSCLRR